MSKLNALVIKGYSLKTRVALLGAPYGNKNAAGPHDSIPGNSGGVSQQARANLISAVQSKLKGATLRQMRSGDHDIIQNGIRVGRVTGGKGKYSAQIGDASSMLSKTPQEAISNLRLGKLYGDRDVSPHYRSEDGDDYLKSLLGKKRSQY